jgi:lipoate-protein ligase A
MFYLDLTLPSLEENLALDEALLLRAEEGGPEVLRVWQWPTLAVVLGAGGVLEDDVHEAPCRADGVPILRRSSGGGTVLLGPGCLLYSVVLPFARDPTLQQLFPSYGYILGRVLEAVRRLGAEADLQGASDLALGDRKVGGSAQQRKRDHLLHHGTLLYAFDAALIGRYLKPPPRQPPYRQQRRHEDFLTNLPTGAELLKQALRLAWQAEQKLSAWPGDLVQQLIVEKYLSPEWIYRR